MKKNKKPYRKKGSGYLVKVRGTYNLRMMTNGKVKQISLGVTDFDVAEKEAQKYLPILEAKKKETLAFHIGEARRLGTQNKLAITDVWESFMNEASRPDSGESTTLRYFQYWELFNKWLTSNHPNLLFLSQVDDDTSRSYFNHLATPVKKGKKIIGTRSGRTLNAHVQALRLVFKVLQEKAGVEKNPFRKEVIARRDVVQISRHEFTEKQALAILGAFRDPDKNIKIMFKDEMRVLFYLGCMTGMREGDCAILKWESVNFDRNLIAVVPMKTSKIVQIPIHSQLSIELREAEKWKDDSGYVLPNIAKRYLYNPDGVRKDAIEVLQKCGFSTTQKIKGKEQRLRSSCIYGFHSFRHSFVSFCANAGIPMAIVQSIVGHGSPAMTRHYTHIGTDTLKTAINSLPMANPKLPKEKSPLDKLKEIQALLTGVETTDREKQILAIISQSDKPDVSSTPVLPS
ncbi:MAG: tyrosine-type recombinase/integrase [Victivallales bacterium]